MIKIRRVRVITGLVAGVTVGTVFVAGLSLKIENSNAAELYGWLDQIDAQGNATGWALDPDIGSQSIDVHFYIDGPAGSGVFGGAVNAGITRSDVNQATGFLGDHGFSWQIPAQFKDGETHTLYVHGIDTSGSGPNLLLSGVPKSFQFQAQAPIGWLDSVSSAGVASGWTYDPDTSSQSIDVHFYIDGAAGSGIFAGSISANLSRPDINQIFGISGDHGYQWQIPPQFKDGNSHTLYVHGIDSSGEGPNLLLLGVPETFQFAAAVPKGALDTLNTDGLVTGWTYDPDTPSQSIQIKFYVDGPEGVGTFAGSANANLSRPDINLVFGISGNHGFSWSIPSQFKNSKPHVLYVYGVDSGGGANALVQNSPKTFLSGSSLSFPTIQSSSFITTAIVLPDYDYGPSIIDDNGVLKMYWCRRQSGGLGDAIWYATSDDKINWSNIQMVMIRTPNSQEVAGQTDGHVCDPSVIKVNGTYYMYYTAASHSGQNNNIFLARSQDGINWTKYPSDNDPQPVIRNTTDPTKYGIGQSVVFYLNNTFYHYYSRIGGDFDLSEMLALSHDGINWVTQNNGNPVISGLNGFNYIPTYLKDYGVFVAIRANTEGTNEGMRHRFSKDGILWTYVPSILDDGFFHNIPIGNNRGSAHNAGILADPEGLVSGSEIWAYYGAGAPRTSGTTLAPETWDIDLTKIQLSSPPALSTPLTQIDITTGSVSISAGDINSDGAVNSLDWSIMSSKWFTDDASADLNIDGVVNSLDWSIMSSNWLSAS